MQGLAVLFAFQLVGIVLHRFGVPLPGTVIGLILFTASLFVGVVKLDKVERTSLLLLRHMLLFFTPVILATTHIIASTRGQLIAFAASLVISLLAVLFTTGIVTDALLKLRTAPEEASAEVSE